ncbi:hypothetical protein HYPSUDRAFT_219152 [Hypholoma sublateritium FD-334 SS-4]|uniref:Uncharacterized protein n=1 Tax=Hypholoma sublateritium (strain FD-334 SS-4) TaxID=945553 RepID=A0A0D2M160_HYPSF|nr:hypothetical protein HYPSUDRAFT_219152 [Hypholoma sublateritium FD-334 SS-4]
MRFLSLALTAVSMVAYMAVPSSADIIAFSGGACDGDEGLNVPCDGSCHQFTGRESFEVVIGGLHCVTFFEDTGCNSLIATFPNEGNSLCSNVNTGTAVGSFRCSANDSCDD